jgi:hypothetical protein
MCPQLMSYVAVPIAPILAVYRSTMPQFVARIPSSTLHQKEYLDISVIHSDGTTAVAKKGGDNLGFSGHKHLKGDKVVPFCVHEVSLGIATVISLLHL